MEGEAPSEKAVGPRSVLFLCGHNSVRSPMAECLARLHLPSGFFIASAGVKAGDRDPFVDAVLAERGLARNAGGPRSLDQLEDDFYDLIVTLSPEAHHAALELTRTMSVDVEYWPTPDPTVATGSRAQIMAAYRDVLERLEARIAARFGTGDAEKARD